LLGLDEVLGQSVCFLLGLGELVRECTSILSLGLPARFANSGGSRFRLAQMAFVNTEVLLLLD
jgi:hypothetical protein